AATEKSHGDPILFSILDVVKNQSSSQMYMRLQERSSILSTAKHQGRIMNLNNASILVTGGSSGIGLETARLLISQGAKVAICGRNLEGLDQRVAGGGALPFGADVSVEADVNRMVQTVIAEFGDYNALVNNAGYGYFAPLIEQALDQFNRLFLTNVTGAMLV